MVLSTPIFHIYSASQCYFFVSCFWLAGQMFFGAAGDMLLKSVSVWKLCSKLISGLTIARLDNNGRVRRVELSVSL